MLQLLTCTQGHQWRGDLPDLGSEAACPVCGCRQVTPLAEPSSISDAPTAHESQLLAVRPGQMDEPLVPPSGPGARPTDGPAAAVTPKPPPRPEEHALGDTLPRPSPA